MLTASTRRPPVGVVPAPGTTYTVGVFVQANFGARRGTDRGSRPYDQLSFLPWDAIEPFFTAVVPGTAEAVANALCAGQEMTGYRGHRVPGLPRDRLTAVFQEG